MADAETKIAEPMETFNLLRQETQDGAKWNASVASNSVSEVGTSESKFLEVNGSESKRDHCKWALGGSRGGDGSWRNTG